MDSLFMENKKFLNQKVNPILEPLVAELMKKQPDDPIAFMKNWIKVNGEAIETKILERIENRPEGIYSTSESEDEDEEIDQFKEEIQFKKLINKKENQKMRVSVSAEAYGDFNKKKQFNFPVSTTYKSLPCSPCSITRLLGFNSTICMAFAIISFSCD